jgi:hypothetical protein
MTDYEKLIEAIETHSGLDRDDIRQAGEHGADAGWAGFTYTVDGAEFYRENAELVDELLQEMADEMGQSVAELVAGFTRSDMCETRDGRDCLMAWFALEEAGRSLNR